MQVAAQISTVILSFAYSSALRARPVVASVQQPTDEYAPTVCTIAGPVCVGAAIDDVDVLVVTVLIVTDVDATVEVEDSVLDPTREEVLEIEILLEELVDVEILELEIVVVEVETVEDVFMLEPAAAVDDEDEFDTEDKPGIESGPGVYFVRS